MKPAEIVDKIIHLREEKSALDKQSDEIKAKIDKLSQQLLEHLDEVGSDQYRREVDGVRYTATISETEVCQVEDWEPVLRWIRRNFREGIALLPRSINNAPWRDLKHVRGGKPIPGTKSYIKRALSVKKTRS